MKKIILTLVSIGLLTGLLTGCGKKPAAANSTGSANVTNSAEVKTGETKKESSAGTNTTSTTSTSVPAKYKPEKKEDKFSVVKAENPDGNIVYKTRTTEFEGYYTEIEIAFKDGKMAKVDFAIIDHYKKKFDENYWYVFLKQPIYKEQAINDWNGLVKYMKQLNEKKDLEKVDVIAGATWSYNLLKNAYNKVMNEVNKKS